MLGDSRRPEPTAANPLRSLPTHLIQELGDVVDTVVHDDPGALAVVMLLHLLQPIVAAPPRLTAGFTGAHHILA